MSMTFPVLALCLQKKDIGRIQTAFLKIKNKRKWMLKSLELKDVKWARAKEGMKFLSRAVYMH